MTLQQKNRKTMAVLAGLALGMVALSFAAVPLYRIFCQVTGFGGTVQQANASETKAIERPVKIIFTANVDRDMPWEFKPSQLTQTVLVGEAATATYEAYNPTDRTITGTAVFNVTPFKAGPYFDKIQCFCFTEQTLAPGERKVMPVTYFVDAAIGDDKNLDDVKEIVLSYTFYLAHSDVAEAAAAEPAAGGEHRAEGMNDSH